MTNRNCWYKSGLRPRIRVYDGECTVHARRVRRITTTILEIDDAEFELNPQLRELRAQREAKTQKLFFMWKKSRGYE